MSEKNLDCEDGACAVDFSKEAETAVKIINKEYVAPIIGLVFLLVGIAFEFYELDFFLFPVNLIWFGVIYAVIGGPIVVKAAKLVVKGDIYNEFVLMSVATLGAFLC